MSIEKGLIRASSQHLWLLIGKSKKISMEENYHYPLESGNFFTDAAALDKSLGLLNTSFGMAIYASVFVYQGERAHTHDIDQLLVYFRLINMWFLKA